MSLPEDDAELPALPPELERELAQALCAAWAPGELDAARHEELLATALEDPFAPPSAEELAESERFRQALEGRVEHPDLELVGALRAAHKSAPLSQLGERRAEAATRKSRSGVVYWSALGLSAVLAAAAMFALWAPRERPQAASEPALRDLAQSRSTAPLFNEAFAGSASARIDRIAEARTRELRDNRYAAWGLR